MLLLCLIDSFVFHFHCVGATPCSSLPYSRTYFCNFFLPYVPRHMTSLLAKPSTAGPRCEEEIARYVSFCPLDLNAPNISLHLLSLLIPEWKKIKFVFLLAGVNHYTQTIKLKAEIMHAKSNKQNKWNWKRNDKWQMTNNQYCVLYLPQVTLEDVNHLWLLNRKRNTTKVSCETQLNI